MKEEEFCFTEVYKIQIYQQMILNNTPCRE